MILQKLTEYYDRKAADPDSGIAPFGWEWKEIPFLIVIDANGSFVHVEDTRETKGKKKVAHSFLLPKGVKRTSGIKSNILWDNVEYVTGIVCKEREERVKEQHEVFLCELRKYSGIPSVASLLKFLENSANIESLRINPDFLEAIETCAFITFRMAGSNEIIASSPDFISAYQQKGSEEQSNISCLITGKPDAPAVLHPSIKGVAGANTTGANIVSFNFYAACSYGKKQGLNSPIGTTAAFAYTTALNSLLGKDSRQKLMVGDSTVVFWSEKNDVFEDAFAGMFAEPPKDDPDRLTENVRALYRSVETGSYSTNEDESRFYVLGLAPNAARLAVRFWIEGAVSSIACDLRRYFDDLSVVHDSFEKDHLSLWRLLISTAQQGKSENINPRLAGEMMRAILSGLPFPETLLQAVLVRTKAERDVSYPRAKLIKGYLCRKFNLTQEERKNLVSINKDNDNVGYRLGRLFATLEMLQSDANPGIKATIRDRFYSAASSSPVTVFGNLIRLSNHWLSKIESDKPGLAVVRKQHLGEITGGLSSFPAHLAISDQGYFALGYYHQKQDFYTKHEKGTEE